MSERAMRVVVGSDSAGAAYRRVLAADLEADTRIESVTDLGVDQSDDTTYGSVAIRAAELVSAGKVDRAVLVCGTGLGVAIAANKVPGIRAATAHDSYSVERSVLSNDCQVLCIGARVIGLELARRLLREWIGYVFDPTTPSGPKVAEIVGYERSRGGADPHDAPAC